MVVIPRLDADDRWHTNKTRRCLVYTADSWSTGLLRSRDGKFPPAASPGPRGATVAHLPLGEITP